MSELACLSCRSDPALWFAGSPAPAKRKPFVIENSVSAIIGLSVTVRVCLLLAFATCTMRKAWHATEHVCTHACAAWQGV